MGSNVVGWAYAKKMPERNLPNWLVRAVSLFDPVTRSVTFELGIRRDCDSSKAKRMLDWSPRSNRESVCATADSMLELGLV